MVPSSADLTRTVQTERPRPLSGVQSWRPPEMVPPDPSSASESPAMAAAFGMGICLVFLRFSMLHQIQTRTMGFNLYLLYIVAIPAMLGLVVAGGLQRSFRGRPTYYWLGFVMWFALATPFSSWRGSSTGLLMMFLRTDLVMLFIIAGLALTWPRCRLMMYAIAWGCVVNLVSARLFARAGSERTALQFGSIADSNEFAAHLLLVLPFLLWMGLSARSVVLRLASLAGVGAGIFVILSTASRGALIALGVDVLFFLWRGPARQKIAVLLLGPIAAVVFVVAVPRSTRVRLTSFTAGDADQEAIDSAESRRYLFRKSIEYTLKFPLFGVGPGQFASYEGRHNKIIGTHGSWHETHNAFTEVASECGIPAFLLFVAGIVSSFRLLSATHREARRRPECRDIETAAFCITLGMVGFCVAIAFLSLAYTFYLPCLGGLAVAVHQAAQQKFRSRAPAAA